jgi:hypothetical protein
MSPCKVTVIWPALKKIDQEGSGQMAVQLMEEMRWL